MDISPDQAADALAQVSNAQRRATTARGYGFAAPYFLLWGCIWIAGYGLSGLWPARAALIWAVADGLGFAGSALLVARRGRRAHSPALAPMGRVGAASATLVAFIVAAYVVLPPVTAAQFAAFPALVIAAAYIAVGIWQGLRWSIVGVVLGVLTVGGFLLLTPYFLFWMAGAGGGTLLLTGLWLRHS